MWPCGAGTGVISTNGLTVRAQLVIVLFARLIFKFETDVGIKPMRAQGNHRPPTVNVSSGSQQTSQLHFTFERSFLYHFKNGVLLRRDSFKNGENRANQELTAHTRLLCPNECLTMLFCSVYILRLHCHLNVE